MGLGHALLMSWESHLESQRIGAEYYSENIGDLWKAVRLELSGETYCGLGRVISKWGGELLRHGSVLKGPWRGKGNLDALLIYEVGSRVEHSMEVCLGVSAISKDELSTCTSKIANANYVSMDIFFQHSNPSL